MGVAARGTTRAEALFVMPSSSRETSPHGSTATNSLLYDERHPLACLALHYTLVGVPAIGRIIEDAVVCHRVLFHACAMCRESLTWHGLGAMSTIAVIPLIRSPMDRRFTLRNSRQISLWKHWAPRGQRKVYDNRPALRATVVSNSLIYCSGRLAQSTDSLTLPREQAQGHGRVPSTIRT
jgi:hypothetical protein